MDPLTIQSAGWKRSLSAKKRSKEESGAGDGFPLMVCAFEGNKA